MLEEFLMGSLVIHHALFAVFQRDRLAQSARLLIVQLIVNIRIGICIKMNASLLRKFFFFLEHIKRIMLNHFIFFG